MALGKLLTGITAIFESNEKDWLALGFCIVLGISALFQWVVIWGLHVNEAWNAGEFFLVMLGPILVYLTAHILVSSNPESIDSWSSHLDRVTRPVMILVLISFLNAWVRKYLIIDGALLNIGWPQLLILALLLVVIAHPKRWLLAVYGVALGISWTLLLASGGLALSTAT